jgi:hypothetical protein
MPKRRKLGNVYTKSPVQLAGKWFIDNLTKVFFTILIWILWFGVFYVILGVINFVGGNVAGLWEKEISTMVFFKHSVSITVYIVGMVLIFCYVFMDKFFRRR